jgi:hypothetical protein
MLGAGGKMSFARSAIDAILRGLVLDGDAAFVLERVPRAPSSESLLFSAATSLMVDCFATDEIGPLSAFDDRKLRIDLEGVG